MPDYLIVGQGISGTFLSYYLQKAGQSVVVIDPASEHTASKVASGIINPVTGRRIVKTWLIDELLPFVWTAYQQLGAELKATLIRQCNVLDFFATPQMRDAFENRTAEEPRLLHLLPDNDDLLSLFRYNYGIGEIDPCYLTDVQTLLRLWRQQLQQNGALREEKWEAQHLQTGPTGVRYKDLSGQQNRFL